MPHTRTPHASALCIASELVSSCGDLARTCAGARAIPGGDLRCRRGRPVATANMLLLQPSFQPPAGPAAVTAVLAYLVLAALAAYRLGRCARRLLSTPGHLSTPPP